MDISEKQYKEITSKLEEHGYKKYTTCLSSNEKVGYFKSIKDEEGELKYMIEYRFWDYTMYPQIPNDYGADILILLDDDSTTHLTLGYTENIEGTEQFAKTFEEFYQKNKINIMREAVTQV